MTKIVIGNSLSTGEPFKVDANKIIMGRTFLTSITRYGKSYSNRRIVEQLVGSAGIVIIDVEGEYGSLREKFPFLIIGKDVPLQLETAEFMAETTLKEDLSVIIDLSMTDEDVGKEYIAAFVDRFMFLETKLRKPYLVVCEEMDEYGPERGIAKATSLKSLRNLAKKGGKRGIGMIVTTHRPAWVSKGIISQCTTLKMIGHVEWESDLDTLREFLQIAPTILRRPKKNGVPIDDGKPHIDCLEPGQFYIAGSAVEKNDFVKVGTVVTTHLGSTPDLIPPTPKELKGIIARLSKTLPKIIEEKIKPAIPPIEQIQKEAEQKANAKMEKKLEQAKRKIEARFKNRVSELEIEKKDLKQRVEEFSRKAVLDQFQPISNVFEHPIVKARMHELPQREQDVLIKIEREPNLTREQLAAFLSSSRETVKNITDKINRKFKVSVIVGYGRPIRYRSMLKRLFITDVAKREMSEIERLQTRVKILEEAQKKHINSYRALESENAMLRQRQKIMVQPEDVSTLRSEMKVLRESVKTHKHQAKEANKRAVKFKRTFDVIEQALKDVEGEPLPKIKKQKPAPSETVSISVPTVSEVEISDSVAEIWLNKLPTLCCKKIFKFLLEHRGMKFSKSQIALQTGYKYTKTAGVFGDAFRILQQNDLVKTDDRLFWVD